MDFYVYESWTRDRGRIHRSDCGFCNDGQGTQVNGGIGTVAGTARLTETLHSQKPLNSIALIYAPAQYVIRNGRWESGQGEVYEQGASMAPSARELLIAAGIVNGEC